MAPPVGPAGRAPLCRFAGLAALLFATLLAAAPAPPAAHAAAASPIAKRLAAVARSPAARRAHKQLGAALIDPAVARASQALLRDHAAALTPFQASLLRVNVLVGRIAEPLPALPEAE